MKQIRWITGFSLVVLLLAACGVTDVASEPHLEPESLSSTTTVFEALLLPENEVHDVDSSATGRATAVLNGNSLKVTGSFQGLEGSLKAVAGTPGHIHEAPVGENGGVVFLLEVKSSGGHAGSFSLTADLTDAQVMDLKAGRYYINLHTHDNPAGELRGQLFPREQPLRLRSDLSGDQEVPPVTTSASGTVRATLANYNLSISGSFSGLESSLLSVAGTPGHVHMAPRGQNGPVVLLLDVTSTGNGSGTFKLNTKLNDAQRSAFRAGLFYVNIHTKGHPSGELRGQLD